MEAQEKVAVRLHRQSAVESGRNNIADEVYRSSAREFSLVFRYVSLFVLFRHSTDWMRQTHNTEENPFYSESTNLNICLIQKHHHRNFQKHV